MEWKGKEKEEKGTERRKKSAEGQMFAERCAQ